jgi:acyl carrier protein
LGGFVTRPSSDAASAKSAIREKVLELASRRGADASSLGNAELLSDSGTLDSVGILELITWFEMTFDLAIPQDDLTIENFGSVDAMAGYLQRVETD